MVSIDGFINNLICAFLNSPSKLEQAPHVILLAMFVTSQPHTGDANKPIRRLDILPVDPTAKGSPDERQIILGWMIDTHLFLIWLPRTTTMPGELTL
jgi:hypothetical protein